MSGLLRHTGDRYDRGAALLDCENPDGSCGRWVRHVFSHEHRMKSSVELLYRCCGCGFLRRWGVLPLPVDAKRGKEDGKEDSDNAKGADLPS
jgi:hypothetical protein